MTTAADACHEIRDQLWDARAGLLRMAPGAQRGRHPGRVLQPIRDTALGAFADLSTGRRERAVVALRSILRHQYPLDGTPWAGTFRVTAQEPPPPRQAVAFRHYDPNWRQFVGIVIWLTQHQYRDELPSDLVRSLRESIAACVAGEPADRIPPWYTNPNLMAAWLEGADGVLRNDARSMQRAEARASMVVARFDRHGDLDEYNSPTYDGVDLMALALWTAFPPSDLFATEGPRMLAAVGERISTLYHPGLRAVAAPYTRAYGIDIRRYVSFLGMWLHLAGEVGVLPNELTVHTDHVHDLGFLPLLSSLAEHVTPSLRCRSVTTERRHAQRFSTTEAVSVCAPSAAFGAERGRRFLASRDQYVPVAAHWWEGADVSSLGCYLGVDTALDATVDGGVISGMISALDDPAAGGSVAIAASADADVSGPSMVVGSATVSFDREPVSIEQPTVESPRWRLGFDRPTTFTVDLPVE